MVCRGTDISRGLHRNSSDSEESTEVTYKDHPERGVYKGEICLLWMAAASPGCRMRTKYNLG
jgi:hypothetical protein